MKGARPIPELVHLARDRVQERVDEPILRDLLREMADALEDIYQPGHIIELTDTGWSIQHPIECRPNLQTCEVHKRAAEEADALKSVPMRGRFPVELVEGRLIIGDRREGGAE